MLLSGSPPPKGEHARVEGTASLPTELTLEVWVYFWMPMTTDKHSARILTYGNTFPILFFLSSLKCLCLFLLAETKATLDVEESKKQNWTHPSAPTDLKWSQVLATGGREGCGGEVRACLVPGVQKRQRKRGSALPLPSFYLTTEVALLPISFTDREVSSMSHDQHGKMLKGWKKSKYQSTPHPIKISWASRNSCFLCLRVCVLACCGHANHTPWCKLCSYCVSGNKSPALSPRSWRKRWKAPFPQSVLSQTAIVSQVPCFLPLTTCTLLIHLCPPASFQSMIFKNYTGRGIRVGIEAETERAQKIVKAREKKNKRRKSTKWLITVISRWWFYRQFLILSFTWSIIFPTSCCR